LVAALSLLPPKIVEARVRREPTRLPIIIGTASWYGYHWQHRPMANGRLFDALAMTAASPTLPLGTMVRVTSLENGSSVIVRIEDRGPYVGARVLDLSLGAARKLDMVEQGLARVKIEPLEEIVRLQPQPTKTRANE